MADSTLAHSVILLTRDGMGSADIALRHKLLDTYFRLLLDHDSRPAAICFYAEGVKVVVEGSPFLDVLGQLEQAGVHLVICQTCLNFFGLSDRIRVGIIGGMGDILEAQTRASKVITL